MPDALLDIPTANIDTRKLTIRQRLTSEDLTTLVQSIERYGVIDPIVVRPIDGGRYELVIGQRRVEACLRLGMPTIPAIVRRLSEERARELAFQSNLQTQHMNIADEVDYLRRADVFHLPNEELATRYGLKEEEAAVARRFNHLPPPIREAVRTGEIDERRALALSRLEYDSDKTRLFRYIRENDPPSKMSSPQWTEFRTARRLSSDVSDRGNREGLSHASARSPFLYLLTAQRRF